MKITDFVKPTNQFLKAIEVTKNPSAAFVITVEPTLVENEFKGKKTMRLHCEGEFNKEPRILDMSKTNARITSQKLGDDTKLWIGHVLYLETYRTKTSDGTLTDAINIKEVK
jgi:hypothetical protein